MFIFKHSTTGKIGKADFDNDVKIIGQYNTREEAEAAVRRKFGRFKYEHPDHPELIGTELDFTVTRCKPDYDTTERFWIEEVVE